MRTIVIAGAGVFGVTAALELRRRGWQVTLVAPAPWPHPRAASTDVSKAVRMDYGTDALYIELADRAIDGWARLNQRWGERIYHEVGILLLSPEALSGASFEGASYEHLRARGVAVERLDRAALTRRFPAWRAAPYADGYFNPRAGWVASARATELLAAEALAAGVRRREGALVGLLEGDSRVAGVRLDDGSAVQADLTLIAAGAWTPLLVPHLGRLLRATGQPVVHLVPQDGGGYDGSRFPVWCADIARTGWYGFPLTDEGVLKIGNHGPGQAWSPSGTSEVEPETIERFRAFAARTFPDLADATVRRSRVCPYCDTDDGDFLIDHDPDRPGLVVAAGDSGHGFKFAPVLGSIVADAVERVPDATLSRFAWRQPDVSHREQARHL